jgi:hypothetical protein
MKNKEFESGRAKKMRWAWLALKIYRIPLLSGKKYMKTGVILSRDDGLDEESESRFFTPLRCVENDKIFGIISRSYLIIYRAMIIRLLA